MHDAVPNLAIANLHNLSCPSVSDLFPEDLFTRSQSHSVNGPRNLFPNMMFYSAADVEELSPVEKGRCGYITAEERGNVDSPENLGLRFHIKSTGTTPFKEINTPTLSGIQFKIQNSKQ